MTTTNPAGAAGVGYFGTDGIRGRMGEEPITPETVVKLGWAAGRVLGEGGKGQCKILIGKDTRVSGYLLESALEAGLSAAGVDIALLGPMPTPAIAYLTRTARARAGIVISASHNPFDDNGIKFFSAEGMKLPDETEGAIERMMRQPLRTVGPRELGKVRRFEDAPGRYIEFCKSTIQQRLTLKGLRVVIDCAHGATYQVAPSVFEELGAEVIAVANEPDGFNINARCGSTYPEFIQRMTVAERADIGVAMDGDGDRVVLADAEGRLVDGDGILYLLALARRAGNPALARRTKDRQHGGVVGTLMTNLGLELALAERHIPFRRAKVGDRYVLAMMQAEGWQLGGEPSGHVICLDKSTTGDGIIAALEVMEAMVRTGRPLSELIRDLRVYPQTMINVRLDRRFDLRSAPAVAEAVRQAEQELGRDGRVVLRPSGTEPVVRVMVEARDATTTERISRQLAEVVRGATAERHPPD